MTLTQLLLLCATLIALSLALFGSKLLRRLGVQAAMGSSNGRDDSGMSASAGVACSSGASSARDLIWHARLAARVAAQAGDGSVRAFGRHMAEDVCDRQALMHDMRGALKRGEFELRYQPKVDAKTSKIVAAEALLRWRHPVRGLLSPDVFIGLAEHSGLIVLIGQWVIDEACRQSAQWRSLGLRINIAVNVSAVQLRDEGFVDKALASLARHGVRPRKLTFEITESVALQESTVVRRSIQRLADAGLHLSIDDFGSGYSNLSQLLRVPLDELKIDKAFVSELTSSALVRHVVKAIIDIGQALGAAVVGEGVETQEQRQQLLDLGCDIFQGYLFAKPMSAEALIAWAFDDCDEQSAFSPALFLDSTTALAGEMFEDRHRG